MARVTNRGYGYPCETRDADPDPSRAFHRGYPRIAVHATAHAPWVITNVEEVVAKGSFRLNIC